MILATLHRVPRSPPSKNGKLNSRRGEVGGVCNPSFDLRSRIAISLIGFELDRTFPSRACVRQDLNRLRLQRRESWRVGCVRVERIAAEFRRPPAFLIDSRPDAYERFVDRLLASPHFGENWARHWMDVVRYGDTYGYEWDIPAKGAWRYRDYLVRAFNSDVPFDQLVREQIAGDLLAAPRVDTNDGRNDSLIGLLFFQLGENRHGDSAEFDGIHQEMIHNKIDAFSKAFQALTIGCARCHDHKFDAVSQRNYYALAGVFKALAR